MTIGCELDLRHWLRDRVGESGRKYTVKWIEPSKWGSSVGQPDCRLTCGRESVDVELKHLYLKTKGIEWKVRPVQRRYHHMGMREGRRSALLASVEMKKGLVILILIRGDKIPLRDYASHPDSGCANGREEYDWLGKENALLGLKPNEFGDMCEKLFSKEWWPITVIC